MSSYKNSETRYIHNLDFFTQAKARNDFCPRSNLNALLTIDRSFRTIENKCRFPFNKLRRAKRLFLLFHELSVKTNDGSIQFVKRKVDLHDKIRLSGKRP